MNNMKSFRLGRLASIYVDILQGMLAISVAILRGKLISPIGITFTIFWVVSVFLLIHLKYETKKQIFLYTVLATITNYVIGTGIAIVFANPYMVITTLVAQWMTAILFLNKDICVPLMRHKSSTSMIQFKWYSMK